MKALFEIQIKDGNCFTSVKIPEKDISHVEKGKWSDEDQDWCAKVILNNGKSFEVYQPMYKKLISIGE